MMVNTRRASAFIAAGRLFAALSPLALIGACGGDPFDRLVSPGDAASPDQESGTSGPDGGTRDATTGTDRDARTEDIVTADRRDATARDAPDVIIVDAGDAVAPDVQDVVTVDARDATALDARDATALDVSVRDAGIVVDVTVLDMRPPGESICYGPFATRRICEGFELPNIPPVWTANTRDGTVTRVGDPTFRGAGALEGSSTATGGEGFVSRPGLGAITSGSAYLTARVRVPAAVPLIGVTTLALFGGPGGISVLLMDHGLAVVVKAQASVPAVVVTGSYIMQRDVWHCMQLAIAISDTEGSVRLTVDDQVAVDGRGLNTAPSGGFEAALAGVIYSDVVQQPIRIWIDELAADNAPIPCP
jgi:hypothetical protein